MFLFPVAVTGMLLALKKQKQYPKQQYIGQLCDYRKCIMQEIMIKNEALDITTR